MSFFISATAFRRRFVPFASCFSHWMPRFFIAAVGSAFPLRNFSSGVANVRFGRAYPSRDWASLQACEDRIPNSPSSSPS